MLNFISVSFWTAYIISTFRVRVGVRVGVGCRVRVKVLVRVMVRVELYFGTSNLFDRWHHN